MIVDYGVRKTSRRNIQH